jgi:hypothetical protein
MLDREDGYALQIRERLGRGVCRGPNAADESVVVAAVSSSCGVPIPTGSPGVWWWEVLLWVSNREVGSSTIMFREVFGLLGGVTGPCADVWAGVAGRVGRGLRGGGVRRPPNRPPLGVRSGRRVFAPA